MEKVNEKIQKVKDQKLIDYITLCVGIKANPQYCEKSDSLLSISNIYVFVVRDGLDNLFVSFAYNLSPKFVNGVLLNLLRKYTVIPENDFIFTEESSYVFGHDNIRSYMGALKQFAELKEDVIN